MTDNFITQTANDYDLDVNIVRDVIDKYPDTFYEELENIINNESKTT